MEEKKNEEEQHSNKSSTNEVTKLYSILSDDNKQKQIGRDIIKALVTDILQSKLASPSGTASLTNEQRDLPNEMRSSVWVRMGTPVITHRRNIKVEEQRRRGELSKTLGKLFGEATLSDEEIRIAKELGIL
jgi:hypothetical protein